MASNVQTIRFPVVKRGSQGKIAFEGNTRQQGVIIVKPIVYGSIARYIGNNREDGHTHQWTVYLKSYTNEDMSVYVKKVQFRLHNSYAEPNRICPLPPYSVTETGWGEFELIIKIFFVDSCERPVTLYHFLKLFHRDDKGNVTSSTDAQISELYDEMVFRDPTLRMFRLLTLPNGFTSGIYTHRHDYEEKKIQDLEKILEAKKKVKTEILELKARLTKARQSIVELKSQVES